MKQRSFAFTKERTIDERFTRFIEANPRVFDLFMHFVREAQRKDRRLGAKAIVERLRWEVAITTDEDIKINNSYTSRLARMAIEKHPELKDFFETRTLKEGR